MLSGNIKSEEDAAALSPVPSACGGKGFSQQGVLRQQGAWCKQDNPLERHLACHTFSLRYMLASRILQVWVSPHPIKYLRMRVCKGHLAIPEPWSLGFPLKVRIGWCISSRIYPLPSPRSFLPPCRDLWWACNYRWWCCPLWAAAEICYCGVMQESLSTDSTMSPYWWWTRHQDTAQERLCLNEEKR